MARLNRDIYGSLQTWKEKSARKPLLLRGARQVGKTFIVRELAKEFPHFIEINFLANKIFTKYFSDNDFDITSFLSDLGAYFSTPIEDGKTLLFFDEIQACPEAITALRFFYEKRPNLHLIAAGSLLEFALAELPSFGVGRVENLFMYPLTFREFLQAIGQLGLITEISATGIKKGLPELLHQAALKHFKNFILLGGMPEIIANFVEHGRIADASVLLEDLILNYEDDFRKYGKRIAPERLKKVWRSAALQAGKKFIYRHAFLDADSKLVHQALNLLVMAGLVYKVYHSDGGGVPVGAEVDLKKFKTLPLDTGVFQRLMGLTLSENVLLDPTDLVNKGALAEVLCGLELEGYSSPEQRAELYYWQREAKNSNAEVDYLLEIAGRVIPVEVKAAKRGSMQSLRLFVETKKSPFGIRVSAENFCLYENILVVPLYAVSEIPRLVGEVLSS